MGVWGGLGGAWGGLGGGAGWGWGGGLGVAHCGILGVQGAHCNARFSCGVGGALPIFSPVLLSSPLSLSFPPAPSYPVIPLP